MALAVERVVVGKRPGSGSSYRIPILRPHTFTKATLASPSWIECEPHPPDSEAPHTPPKINLVHPFPTFSVHGCISSQILTRPRAWTGIPSRRLLFKTNALPTVFVGFSSIFVLFWRFFTASVFDIVPIRIATRWKNRSGIGTILARMSNKAA